jgi:hypothetical protein
MFIPIIRYSGAVKITRKNSCCVWAAVKVRLKKFLGRYAAIKTHVKAQISSETPSSILALAVAHTATQTRREVQASMGVGQLIQVQSYALMPSSQASELFAAIRCRHVVFRRHWRETRSLCHKLKHIFCERMRWREPKQHSRGGSVCGVGSGAALVLDSHLCVWLCESIFRRAAFCSRLQGCVSSCVSVLGHRVPIASQRFHAPIASRRFRVHAFSDSQLWVSSLFAFYGIPVTSVPMHDDVTLDVHMVAPHHVLGWPPA